MPSQPFYTSQSFWLYACAWMPFFCTALTYGFGARWWTTAIGRSLFLTVLSILAVLTNVLVSFIFPHYMFRDLVRFALIGGVIIAGWYQFSAILRVQLQFRAEQRGRLQHDHEEIK